MIDGSATEPLHGSTEQERSRIEAKYASRIKEEPGLSKLVSYVGNKKTPILRLYRYKEAFAFQFVQEFIRRFDLNETDYLFDPFCGMGTTLFAATESGISSTGVDKLPIATFVSETLPLFLSVHPGEINAAYKDLEERVGNSGMADVASDVRIMSVAFPEKTLDRLRQWKAAIDELSEPLRSIFLLLFFAILEPCSYTSKDGQFLRLKRDKRVGNPDEILAQKVFEAEADIVWLAATSERNGHTPSHRVHLGDARNLKGITFDKRPTAIITSPPYGNRYDCTRTYSLELCFHFVKNFKELRELRHGVLRSHIESKVGADESSSHPLVREVVKALSARSSTLNNPRIPDMLTAYFVDMEKVIAEWSRVLAPGGKVAMVVDNVRFDGELVPVDLVLSEIAEGYGFDVNEIIVARYKGNSSQQMGKYGRVPVRESVVVWEKAN